MSVMNVKRSAQTFSKAEQTSAMKNDVSHSASATAEQQAMGDQNVGDVLNKVADPNWVDPSKKVRAAGNNQLDKDAFLKLMLTQMKYQDPTNPMQSHEMAAQLAQFTSLEQLNNINMTLSGMSKAQQPQTNYQALALIGKKISGDSSKVMRSAGDTKHGIGFELMGDAGKVRITIKDSAGTLVKKLDVGALKKGANTVEWNGLNEEGSAARPGEYRVSVEGVSNTGAKIYAKTSFEGRITGLNYTQEGPVLLVGNKSVKLSEVKKIEESGPEDAAPGAGAPAIDLKSGTGESAKADQMKSILAMMSKQKGPGVAGAIGAGASAGAVLGSQSVQAPSAALNPAATVVKPEAKTLTAAQARSASKSPGQPSTPAPAATSEPTSGSSSAPVKAQPGAVVTASDENIPAAEEDFGPVANIDSVPMASALLNQVAKETK